MGDRRVAPVQDSQSLLPGVDVVHVQIVVLDRLGDRLRSQLSTKLLEARSEDPELLSVVPAQRQVLVQQFLVTGRESLNAKVGHTEGEVVEDIGHLTPLELGVQRKDRKPMLRQIPEVTDPSPRIGHQ